MLVVVTGLHGQTPEKAVALNDPGFDAFMAKRDAPVISGKLLHLPDTARGKFAISYSLVTPFSSRQQKNTAEIQQDGSFRIVLKNALPYQQIWFSAGDQFYGELIVNHDLDIQLDAPQLLKKDVEFYGRGVAYGGTDGPLNTYINNYVLYRRSDQLRLSDSINKLLFPSTRDAIFDPVAYREAFQGLRGLTREYIAENPSPYSWLLHSDLEARYIGGMIARYWGKTLPDSLWTDIRKTKVYAITNNGTQFYSSLANYLKIKIIESARYTWHNLVGYPGLSKQEQSYVDSLKMFEGYPNKSNMGDAGRFTETNARQWNKNISYVLKKYMQQHWLQSSAKLIDSLFDPITADILKIQLCADNELSNIKSNYETILPMLHEQSWIKLAGSDYAYTLAKIEQADKAIANSVMIKKPATALGKPLMATDFGAQLYLAKHIKAEEFLAQLHAAFPGRGLFVDRWATWCAPCLGEMPYSKKLAQATTDLPVIFVYLCTANGSDMDKWKTQVGRLRQPGVHIFIDETLDADLSHLLSFNGYPAYGFINLQGKYQSASRPSTLDRDALNKMLQGK